MKKMTSTEAHVFDLDMKYLSLRAAKEAGYKSPAFDDMRRRVGGVAAAQALLQPQPLNRLHTGLMRLAEANRLDLSVENLVILPRWREYFPEEQKEALKRLKAVGATFI